MSIITSYNSSDLNFHYTREEFPCPSAFKMHTHEWCEILWLVNGHGVFHIEDSEYLLCNGDILIMRPSELHYIEIDPKYTYERMVINFSPHLFESIDPGGQLTELFFNRPAGKNNRYSSNSFSTDLCRLLLQNMITEQDDMRLCLMANMPALFVELKTAVKTQEITGELGSITYRIISYINHHLTEDLSLTSLCQHFFISKSYLCKIFKNATGSGVWEYITIKRLMHAQQLIRSGHPAAVAAEQSGFHDYSTFYRAHIKQFQMPTT